MDISVVDLLDSTSLHHLVQNNNIPVTSLLLKRRNLNPNCLDYQRQTPLNITTQRGDIFMVKLLLRRADIQVNNQDQPPLCIATREGHSTIVRRLLRSDTIDPNQKHQGRSPLYISIGHGHREIATILLKQGTKLDINTKTATGEFALQLAVYYRHLDILDLILKDNRLNVTATCDKYIALSLAAERGRDQVVRRLLRDPRVRSSSDIHNTLTVARF